MNPPRPRHRRLSSAVCSMSSVVRRPSSVVSRFGIVSNHLMTLRAFILRHFQNFVKGRTVSKFVSYWSLFGVLCWPHYFKKVKTAALQLIGFKRYRELLALEVVAEGLRGGGLKALQLTIRPR